MVGLIPEDKRNKEGSQGNPEEVVTPLAGDATVTGNMKFLIVEYSKRMLI